MSAPLRPCTALRRLLLAVATIAVVHAATPARPNLVTLLALAQVPAPREHKLDGVSLASHLLAGRPLPARTVFWGHSQRYAVRQGPWKLVVNQAGPDDAKARKKSEDSPAAAFFNLDDDLGEKTNLAAREPARVAQLEAALADWRKDVAASAPRH